MEAATMVTLGPKGQPCECGICPCHERALERNEDGLFVCLNCELGSHMTPTGENPAWWHPARVA